MNTMCWCLTSPNSPLLTEIFPWITSGMLRKTTLVSAYGMQQGQQEHPMDGRQAAPALQLSAVFKAKPCSFITHIFSWACSDRSGVSCPFTRAIQFFLFHCLTTFSL